MKKIDQILQTQLHDIKEQGTFKNERIIETAQESEISVNGKKVLNFCANNYLGLANKVRFVEQLCKLSKNGVLA